MEKAISLDVDDDENPGSTENSSSSNNINGDIPDDNNTTFVKRECTQLVEDNNTFKIQTEKIEENKNPGTEFIPLEPMITVDRYSTGHVNDENICFDDATMKSRMGSKQVIDSHCHENRMVQTNSTEEPSERNSDVEITPIEGPSERNSDVETNSIGEPSKTNDDIETNPIQAFSETTHSIESNLIDEPFERNKCVETDSVDGEQQRNKQETTAVQKQLFYTESDENETNDRQSTDLINEPSKVILSTSGLAHASTRRRTRVNVGEKSVIETNDRQSTDLINEPSQVILSTSGLAQENTRRRTRLNVGEQSVNDVRCQEEDTLKDKPHFKRRKVYNIVKHVISIVFVVLDLVIDWVEYSEMNKTGNYSIAVERRLKNVEFTYECEGTGKEIQFVFLIFTVIGTILSTLQILNIIYQIFYEVKGVYIDKKLIQEYVETFILLFFIEISQILLIMGFYDVCSLDCVINGTEILIALNAVSSYLKITWRFSTSFRCCTVYWKIPKIPTPSRSRQISHTSVRRPSPTIYRNPAGGQSIPSNDPSSGCHNNCQTCALVFVCILFPPLILCLGLYYIIENCNKDQADTPIITNERARRKWKCERSCKCFTLRCFPSRFEDPETNACDCTCGQCMSCERVCGCCVVRCFPSEMIHPKSDIFNCRCADCMSCKLPCKCFTLRCFPQHLNPPHDDICTCRCAECLACTLPFKCFTFRCFPEFLNPSHPVICTCRCAECLACTLPCKCFTFRCFPESLNPSHPDICTCRCAECLACALPCKCFTFRCFPQSLTPSHSDICTCSCGECLSFEIPCKCFICRCFPQYQSADNWFDCTCGDCMKCEQNCCCCILRCFPSLLGKSESYKCILKECTTCEKSFGCFLCRCFPSALTPAKDDIFTCTCGDCLACQQNLCCCKIRCCPTHLEPSEDKWCECKTQCVNRVAPSTPPTQRQRSIPLDVVVIRQPKPILPPLLPPLPPPPPPPPQAPLVVSIINQPIPHVPQPPPPPRTRKPVCRNCCRNFLSFFIAVVIFLILLMLVFYTFLEIVQIRYVLVCHANDTLMNSTQHILVQNYLKLFKL